MNDFFDVVRRFLLDYLPKQRCLSENTILSYRQTLNLFVAYMRDEMGIGATELTFSRIDRDAILGFLAWLENARRCSVSTRNQRLMALRSFLDFAGQIDCTQTALYLSACNIPSKESHGRIVEFLTEPSLTALLQQPDPSKPKDLRNLVFMILMYDTAARCSELLDMKVCDLRLDAKHPIAYLHGKGRKIRTVPLLSKTVQHCKQYLRKFHPTADYHSEAPLFFTVIHGTQQKNVSRYGICVLYKIRKHGEACLPGSPGTHPPAYDAAHTGNALIPVWNAHGAAFAVSWPCTG